MCRILTRFLTFRSYQPAIHSIWSEQQFAANFVLIANNQILNGNEAVVGVSGKARAVAWAIRAIFEAWSATKQAEANGPLPPWLMPSSYFDTILKNCIPFFETWTKSTARWATVFHFLPNITNIEPWENKYQAVAMMLGVLVGRDDYKAIAEWVVQDTINWTKTVPAYPDPYYFTITTPAATWASGSPNTNFSGPPAGTPDTDFYSDLGTAFVAWATADPSSVTAAQLATLQTDASNGGVLIQTQPDYTNFSRGVCAFATYLNTLSARFRCRDAPKPLPRPHEQGHPWSRWRHWLCQRSLGLPAESERLNSRVYGAATAYLAAESWPHLTTKLSYQYCGKELSPHSTNDFGFASERDVDSDIDIRGLCCWIKDNHVRLSPALSGECPVPKR